MNGLTAVAAMVVLATIPPTTFVNEFRWEELAAQGKVVNGTVDRAGRLTVRNDRSEPRTITVLTVDDPGITQPTYAFWGEVSYKDVEGQGCLEMWSYFPDGSHFFSRTLAVTGPLQSLSGSSDRRPFILPFYLKDDAGRPSKLVLNVVLPGKGSVTLDTVQLLEYASGTDPLKAMGLLQTGAAWWDDRMGGLVGGTIGAVFGLLGAAVGVFAGRGKARDFVMGVCWAMRLVGVVCLVFGLLALVRSQPYGVWFPLLLPGILLLALGFGLVPTIRKRYDALELSRMQAKDAP